ncbi:MAG: TerB family tellurite resistance protein [Myxococcota bacterium]
MLVSELTDGEREVLFGLLTHLVAADARFAAGESAELDELGEEMGVGRLDDALAAARQALPTADAAIAAAAGITRPDARELVRTLLFDLAHADGERTPEEDDLLVRVAKVWARP